jgi:hypothetical protein
LRYHRNNDVNIEPDQLGGKLIEPIKLPVRKSVLDDEVPPLDIAKLAERTLEFIVIG